MTDEHIAVLGHVNLKEAQRWAKHKKVKYVPMASEITQRTHNVVLSGCNAPYTVPDTIINFTKKEIQIHV